MIIYIFCQIFSFELNVIKKGKKYTVKVVTYWLNLRIFLS